LADKEWYITDIILGGIVPLCIIKKVLY